MAFVERSTESKVLSGLLDDCLDGRGAVTMVTGPVGSGKTELMRTFAQEAADRGATVLRATASRTERVLPLGVLGQLFAGADLSEEQRRETTRLLSDGALGTMPSDRGSEVTQRVTAPVLDGVASVLFQIAESTPLLISVDDVHFADLASLHCLLYLVHRSVRARVMVVVNEAARVRQAWPMFRADLLSQPQCRRIRLGPLSPQGVTTVLAERVGAREARQLGPVYHDICGGNPLLLDALVEDHLATGHPATTTTAGDAFAQGVMTCLYRSDFLVLRLARVLATLVEPAPPAAIAELLGVDAVSTIRAIDTATEMGLLHKGQFRHIRARLAVLEAMAPEERSALHERAAYQLYKDGAPALTVARHEIAARHVGEAWSAPVLREAAEHALDDDDLGYALECLQLAKQACVSDADRVATKAAMVRVQWRVDPWTARRNVSDLLEAARAGTLSGQSAVDVADYLTWYGRADEAIDLLGRVTATAQAADLDTATALYSTGAHLAYTFPGLADRLPADQFPPRLSAFGTATRSLSVQAASLVGRFISDGLDEEALNDAEGILQQSRLHEPTCGLIIAPLEMLIFEDRLDTAARWCDPLLSEAKKRQVPTWSARLAAVRATICLRQGDLAGAEQHARAALSHVTPSGLGVYVGVPLSILLLTPSLAGHAGDALSQLNAPVPEAMFQTVHGLHFMRARGRYYLARGRHHAAVMEFLACRDLMASWRLDRPGIVPWRTDLAEVQLGLGRPDLARELAEDQLARLSPGHGRTRGLSLRVLAAASPLRHRPGILREAVDVLQQGGDLHELAGALADLSVAQHELGDAGEARQTDRLAAHVATQRRGDSQPAEAAEAPPDSEEHATPLSNAEHRVAALAAQGHTNLQIARKLEVTVSTVEQHLTKVYRKLRVNRRTDLPVTLLGDWA